MAVPERNIPSKNFDFKPDEVSKIQRALKDEKFVKLLADYAKELADPATKAHYEAEIRQLEDERGYAVTFLHPAPGYVLKVNDQRDPQRKVVINICSDVNIDKPVSVVGQQG